MYKFPLRLPEGWRVIVTQGFKSTELAEWYTKQGISYQEHLAIDLVVGTPDYQQWATYGAAIVCPFPSAELIALEPGTNPGDQKSGRFQVRYTEPDGTVVIMGGIHCSDVADGKTSFTYGEDIAYIGNGGYVDPAPTKEDAYAGGHLHLSYIRNGVVRDPTEIFNIYDPFRGKDSGFEKDIRPIAWAMGWSKEKIAEIITMFRKAL